MRTESTYQYSDADRLHRVAYETQARQRATGAYMQKVFGFMFLGLGIIMSVAIIIGGTPGLFTVLHSPIVLVPIVILPFIQIIYMSIKKDKMSRFSLTANYLILSTFLGSWMSYIPKIAVEHPEFGIIALVTLGAVTVMFAGLAFLGFFLKRDISGWGTFLISALFGLIAVGILGNIVPLGASTIGLFSVIGILVFAAFIAYDTQRIKQEFLMEGDNHGNAIFGAVSLLLDFLNMYQYALRLAGINIGND